jgi:hypothetical protein
VKFVHEAPDSGKANSQPVARAHPIAERFMDVGDPWTPIGGDDADSAGTTIFNHGDGDLARRGECHDVPDDFRDGCCDDGEVATGKANRSCQFPALLSGDDDVPVAPHLDLDPGLISSGLRWLPVWVKVRTVSHAALGRGPAGR